VIKLIDPNVPFSKNLARLHEGLGAHRERMVNFGIFDEGGINHRCTLA
jgi:hypothetical protein